MNKYTLIFVECFHVGSHRQYITQMLRVQGVDAKSAIESSGVNIDDVVFIFEGHPKLEGEDVS